MMKVHGIESQNFCFGKSAGKPVRYREYEVISLPESRVPSYAYFTAFHDLYHNAPTSSHDNPVPVIKKRPTTVQTGMQSQDQQPTRPRPFPSPRRLTQQLTKEWSTRPSASATRARVLRSSASSTCLRSTRPRSRNPLSAWPRPLLEAPFMARDHPALECQRCLRPKPMGHLVSTTLGLEVPVLSSPPQP